MFTWIKALDRILRGEATRPTALREGTIDVPVFGLAVVIVALGLIYGACMGTYSLFREATVAHAGEPIHLQLVASTVKVPALFLLTLLVTFPSLYVFNALVGSRLTILPVLRLLIASLGVNLAVLSSLGPIVAFFSVNTTNYSFMILLNVFVFSVSGMLGLVFLLQTLNRMTVARQTTPPPLAAPAVARRIEEEPAPDENAAPNGDPSGGASEADSDAPAEDPGSDAAEPAGELVPARIVEPSALDAIEGHVLGRHVKSVFACWMVVFGLVGAQMGWVLRPFIGCPNKEFTWFRERDSNFFEAVWQALVGLLTGGG